MIKQTLPNPLSPKETLIKIKGYTVVKRDGSLVPFLQDRILFALESAFRDTKKIEKGVALDASFKEEIALIASEVASSCFHLALKGVTLTVEGIQDLVEMTLMKRGYHDVARDYIVYRDRRSQERKGNEIKIYRHDRRTPIRFNPMKITATVEKAFKRLLKEDEELSSEAIEAINRLSQLVVKRAIAHAETDTLSFEVVQNFIEFALMEGGFFAAAKQYILYRAEKEQHQAVTTPLSPSPSSFTVKTEDGKEIELDEHEVVEKFKFAARGLQPTVDVNLLVKNSLLNFYKGITEKEVDISNILSAKSLIERDHSYSKVASRLLLDVIYRETMGVSAADRSLDKEHKRYFQNYIKRGVSLKRLTPKLLEFDLDQLSLSLDLSKDDLFHYLGLQTLYDRYFIHNEDKKLETPQIFWMRVAMGLALLEKENTTARVIEFYQLLSSFLFTSGTPTLFNSGTMHSQLSSCYLSTIQDDLHHIFKVVADDAQLSKWAGGIGNDWTNVRATGALIKGTNGKSQGVIPFLKVANDTAVAVNQGGKRKGAMCAYLETWHLDIEDFLELRKNTGDERRRTHDMNTANWVPDLFMKRVEQNGKWTLFSPSDVPDLHDLYGKAFEKRYEEYEKKTETGEIKLFKQLDAADLYKKMLSMLFETGHPWITFKDPSNIRSPQDHVGVVHSSNLCTEILLNTSAHETAVCNLGSINLALHTDKNGLDEKKLAQTIRTAIRMLDNVIDINFYPTQEAEASNLRHRPIGLGLMGFQDALYIQNISNASAAAVEFADRSMEMISYYAIEASSDLAKERGCYSTYKGSKWDRGLLPIDTLELLEQERGEKIEVDRSSTMDWKLLREKVRQQGMRNSNTMAIAPTATIANITGVTQSIEPMYKNLFVKSNLSGEFTVINPFLIDKLKELNLWDNEMLDDLKYFDGSLLEIERIPDGIKQLFLTAFEIEPEWIIECAARRQKWIDMGQSLNLYLSQPSGKKLYQMYLLGWRKGLKTNYYLRSLAATQVEKASIDLNKRGLQPRWMKNKSASSSITVERQGTACSLDGSCESCQ